MDIQIDEQSEIELRLHPWRLPSAASFVSDLTSTTGTTVSSKSSKSSSRSANSSGSNTDEWFEVMDQNRGLQNMDRWGQQSKSRSSKAPSPAGILKATRNSFSSGYKHSQKPGLRVDTEPEDNDEFGEQDDSTLIKQANDELLGLQNRAQEIISKLRERRGRLSEALHTSKARNPYKSSPSHHRDQDFQQLPSSSSGSFSIDWCSDSDDETDEDEFEFPYSSPRSCASTPTKVDESSRARQLATTLKNKRLALIQEVAYQKQMRESLQAGLQVPKQKKRDVNPRLVSPRSANSRHSASPRSFKSYPKATSSQVSRSQSTKSRSSPRRSNNATESRFEKKCRKQIKSTSSSCQGRLILSEERQKANEKEIFQILFGNDDVSGKQDEVPQVIVSCSDHSSPSEHHFVELMTRDRNSQKSPKESPLKSPRGNNRSPGRVALRSPTSSGRDSVRTSHSASSQMRSPRSGPRTSLPSPSSGVPSPKGFKSAGWEMVAKDARRDASETRNEVSTEDDKSIDRRRNRIAMAKNFARSKDSRPTRSDPPGGVSLRRSRMKEIHDRHASPMPKATARGAHQSGKSSLHRRLDRNPSMSSSSATSATQSVSSSWQTPSVSSRAMATPPRKDRHHIISGMDRLAMQECSLVD